MTFQTLFLLFPLLIAAVAQGLFIKYDWFSELKRPLDFGLSHKGKRVFGEHKTWRGLILNMVFCTLGTQIQRWLLAEGDLPDWLPLLEYRDHGYIVGVLLGLGMTVGELPNSFLKRQLDIPPGKKHEGPWKWVFFFFDQVDLLIGIWLFLLFLIRPTLVLVLWSFFVTFLLHMIISTIGYLLGMRQTLV